MESWIVSKQKSERILLFQKDQILGVVEKVGGWGIGWDVELIKLERIVDFFYPFSHVAAQV